MLAQMLVILKEQMKEHEMALLMEKKTVQTMVKE